MDSFFDLIFENPFLLFFILAALFSLFSRGKKVHKQQGEQAETDRPTLSETMKRAKEMMETFDFPFDEQNEKEPQPTSQHNRTARTEQPIDKETPITAQQQRLYDALQQYEGIDNVENLTRQSNLQDTRASTSQNSVNELHTHEINMPLRLQREGLVESIIMAEVLGPPRARQRYANTVTRRTSL